MTAAGTKASLEVLQAQYACRQSDKILAEAESRLSQQQEQQQARQKTLGHTRAQLGAHPVACRMVHECFKFSGKAKMQVQECLCALDVLAGQADLSCSLVSGPHH